jgi:hypothetical protein
MTDMVAECEVPVPALRRASLSQVQAKAIYEQGREAVLRHFKSPPFPSAESEATCKPASGVEDTSHPPKGRPKQKKKRGAKLRYDPKQD